MEGKTEDFGMGEEKKITIFYCFVLKLNLLERNLQKTREAVEWA